MVTALDLAAAGKVTPMVETFPLDAVHEAVERVESGKVRFRAILRMV